MRAIKSDLVVRHTVIHSLRDKFDDLLLVGFGFFNLLFRELLEVEDVLLKAFDNIFLDPIMRIIRKKYICPIQFEKGSKGTRKIIKHISANQPLALMVDQRLSSSIRIPFFNKEATTTTMPAQLALKYDAILVPVWLKRIYKTKFEFFIEKPMQIIKTNNYDNDVFNITLNINKKIEEFIKRQPAHWLWSHDRWK